MAQPDSNYGTSAPPCKSGKGSQIIYAWAKDAPDLTLPVNTGFRVGKRSQIK